MNADNVTPAYTLQEECKLTQQLIDLLKQEQAHLIKADIEGIIAITAEKSRAAAEMATLTGQRYKNLAKAGFSPQESGMKEWLHSSAAYAEAEKSWENLLKLAKSAKNLNHTNGLLIHKHISRTQKALSILQRNNPNANFYGPNGKPTSQIRARGLVVG